MYDNSYNRLAWIRGLEKEHVTIGEGCWIGPFCVIDGEYNKVTLGKGVNVSSGAQILTHDTAWRCVSQAQYNVIDHAPTEIGDFTYIGTNAVILKGAKVGKHCIIAAGAVVKENMVIPDYSMVAGVPAQIKKNIEQDLKNKISNNDTI
jgi:acetyltransferase-like isoleucine patch superfamily enzyme